MKEIILICLSFWIFSGLPGVATAESDEAAILRTITESTNAITNLPQTKNRQAALRFYTEDYSSILDGVVSSRKITEMSIDAIINDVKGGISITTTVKPSNIRAMASAGMGWARYEEFIDFHSSELVIAKGDVKCTGVLRKIGIEWKIQHEHCSSTRDQSDATKE